MKIAIDYQIFAEQEYGGISRYFASLTRELSRMGEGARVVAPVYRNRYLGDLDSKVVAGWPLGRVPGLGNRHVQRAINTVGSHLLMSAWHPDVVHETYYSTSRSGPRRVPVVVTVFDMIHELFPEQFPGASALTERKLMAVRRADHIICISANTRNDLVRLFGCSPERTTVIHLAAEAWGHTTNSGVALVLPATPFLLHVGARAGYKNFSRLLEAVASSTRLRRDVTIAAVGGGKLSPDETAAIDRLGLGGRVVHFGEDDSTLDQLYRRAVALVYPSLYEGFGLPPLEAMARSCPVTASNTSSMPEVIGDAGELFDPTDVGAMSRAIETVVYSDDRRRDLAAFGTARVARYSWRRCAEETLAIYRSVMAA